MSYSEPDKCYECGSLDLTYSEDYDFDSNHEIHTYEIRTCQSCNTKISIATNNPYANEDQEL